MRTITLAGILMLGTFTSQAVDKGKPVDLTGNWKETRRMSKDKTALDYTDTIKIDFTIGNEFLWQKTGSFVFKGVYKATTTSLDLGSRYFTVLESSKQRMLLQDDEGIYELSRYKKAEVVEDNSKAASASRATNDVNGTIELSALGGTWQTFKRTSKVQQASIDYKRILKKVILQVNGKSVNGELHAAQEQYGVIDWTVDRYEKSTLYFKGKDVRQLKVLKCSEGELILEEGDYTYFLKKFS